MIHNSLPTGLTPNLRILIVEDEDAIATRYKSGLIDSGMRENNIIIASCVEQTEAAIGENAKTFDVIILDVMLPVSLADLQKVKSVEVELVEIRKAIRKEESLSPEDDEARRAIEDAYNKRPQLLEQISKHRRREAALDMIQRAGDKLADWPRVVIVTAYGDDETVHTTESFR